MVGALGRGGAELQLMALADAMVRRGHEVEVLLYAEPSVLDDELRARGVVVHVIEARGRRAKVAATRAWFDAYQPEVVHGVMKRASSLALLARLPRAAPAVIATDMSTATYGRRKPELWASLLVFALANRVVTQTETNRASLARLAPWLRAKTTVVRNGLDTQRFSPHPWWPRDTDDVFTFCVVGTVYAVKNPDRVVRAVAELVRRGFDGFRVRWYGRLRAPNGYESDRHPAVNLAKQLGVDDRITFEGEVTDVERVYRDSDAILHASVQEGFPNVVAEAMACGLPVVVSNVSDLPAIVRKARNGVVFDPLSSSDIASAMEWMLSVEACERQRMGQRSRACAVDLFAMDRFADDFEAVYRTAWSRGV